jgi:hypothetical protein
MMMLGGGSYDSDDDPSAEGMAIAIAYREANVGAVQRTNAADFFVSRPSFLFDARMSVVPDDDDDDDDDVRWRGGLVKTDDDDDVWVHQTLAVKVAFNSMKYSDSYLVYSLLLGVSSIFLFFSSLFSDNFFLICDMAHGSTF